MKASLLLPAILGACTSLAKAQGTFVYDQQSNTTETPPNWEDGSVLQQIPPLAGQSFTPGLTSVGFIRLKLLDHAPGNGLGATLRVDLVSGSIGGALLGHSQSVELQDGFRGVVDFLFPAPVTVAPGVMYYMRPTVESGDLWKIIGAEYRYAGGTCFYQSEPLYGCDLWFRSGIIVPEPGTGAVLGLGLGLLAWIRRPRAS